MKFGVLGSAERLEAEGSSGHDWMGVSDLAPIYPSDHLGVYSEARLGLQQGEPHLPSLEPGRLQVWADVSESCRG